MATIFTSQNAKPPAPSQPQAPSPAPSGTGFTFSIGQPASQGTTTNPPPQSNPGTNQPSSGSQKPLSVSSMKNRLPEYSDTYN